MIMTYALIYQAIGNGMNPTEKALYLLGPIHVRLNLFFQSKRRKQEI